MVLSLGSPLFVFTHKSRLIVSKILVGDFGKAGLQLEKSAIMSCVNECLGVLIDVQPNKKHIQVTKQDPAQRLFLASLACSCFY